MGANKIFSMRKIMCFFSVFISLLSFGVNAQDNSAKTMGDTDRLKSKIYYYKQVAELNKAMAEAGEGSAALFSNSANKSNDVNGNVQSSSAPMAMPVIEKLMNNAVKIRYPDGQSNWKKKGQVVIDGYILSDVSVTGVWITSTKTGERIQLNDKY